MTLVHAIQEATSAIVSGEGRFTKTSDSLKKLRGLLFPEYAIETEEKAKRSKVLLEQELAKGPLTVQALDYDTGKKRRRRK